MKKMTAKKKTILWITTIILTCALIMPAGVFAGEVNAAGSPEAASQTEPDVPAAEPAQTAPPAQTEDPIQTAPPAQPAQAPDAETAPAPATQEPEPEPALQAAEEPEAATDPQTPEEQTEGWVTDAEGHVFFYENGVPVTGLKFIEGHYHFFDNTGVMITGAVNIGDKRYYFDAAAKAPGAMWTRAGWKTFGADRYYFISQADGTACMKTGWLKENGKKWYFNKKTGIMTTGWKKLSGNKYYFRENDANLGQMATGLKTIDGYRYYFSSKGIMKVGAIAYKGKLYYFRDSGRAVMKTGWFKGSDKKKRYSLGKGRVATGQKKIKGVWYAFSSRTGILTRRIGDDVDKKFQSYTSSTRYLMVVKLSEHKVRIYRGGKNRWSRIHTYSCTTGAPSTPTVRGTFSIGAKGLYFNTGTAQRCWYYTQFCGNYLFHSIIYDRSSSPRNVVDGRLGISASHGCIRLALANAKWIYRNIPRGTKVVIY